MRKFALAFALLFGLANGAAAQAPSPVPALPDSARTTTYSISGTTCACAVGFQIYGSGTDVDQWIQVFVNGVAKLSTDPTFGWSLSSVTGPLGSIPRPITNAVLTFNAVQTGTIIIVGDERPRRLSQFPENRGVAARDLNQAITDVVAVQRELWDRLNSVSAGTGVPIFNVPNTWPASQIFTGGFTGGGPVNMLNIATPTSFTTPGFSFNDNGVAGLSFLDTQTHLAFSIGGNSPATGTGSYAGLNVTQFGVGRSVSSFVTGALMNAIAIGGGGNYSGSNPYVVVCGTAVIAGQCPLGTAAALQSAVGMEVDIFSFAGATMLYKEGIRIADLGAIQASGAGNLSAGISLARASTSPGFVYGIYFGDPTIGDNNFPLTTTGSAMKLSTTARAIDSIIDGSGLAGGVTNGAIRLPDSVTAIKWTSWSLLETSGLVAFQIGGTLNAALFQAAASTFSGTVQSGNPGTNAGGFILQGSASGAVTIQPGAAASGTFNFNLPVTSGSAGNVLASGGGGAAPMTWITGVTTVCTITAGNSYTFTNGVLTTKGANCT